MRHKVFPDFINDVKFINFSTTLRRFNHRTTQSYVVSYVSHQRTDIYIPAHIVNPWQTEDKTEPVEHNDFHHYFERNQGIFFFNYFLYLIFKEIKRVFYNCV